MNFSPSPQRLEGNPEALACYRAIQARLRVRGLWRDEYVFGAASVALQCAAYLSDAREMRRIETPTQHEARELELSLQRTHRLARQGLALFHVIETERVAFSVMSADGLDELIAGLCTPRGPESAH